MTFLGPLLTARGLAFREGVPGGSFGWRRWRLMAVAGVRPQLAFQVLHLGLRFLEVPLKAENIGECLFQGSLQLLNVRDGLMCKPLGVGGQ